MVVSASTISSLTFDSLIVSNGGLVFGLLLLFAIIFVAVRSGVRNGIVLYLIAGLVCVLGVTIGAFSHSILIFLSIPLILIIVFKMIVRSGSE